MKRIFFGLVFVFFAAKAATAQIAPPRFSVPDPGHVLAPAPASPRVIAPQALSQQLSLPSLKAGHLRFSQINIIGKTRLPLAAVQAVFTPLKNRMVTATELKAALDRVDALYVDAGLPLGRAFIPAQRLEGGVLTIRLLEGYIAHIAVTADRPSTKALVEHGASRLLSERPLTRAALERVMLNLQEIPGITLGSEFRDMDPGTGATTLVIAANIRRISVGFSLDNRSALAGLPVQPFIIASLNNMLGWGDQITLTALLSPRQKDYAFYDLAYSQPVGRNGLTAGMEGSWAQALDTVNARPYTVKSRNLQLAARVRYPLIRALDETLNASGRIYFTNANYGLAGYSGPLAHDRYVAGEFWLEYGRAFSTDFGIGGSLKITQGMTGLAGEPHTRADTVPTFTKLRLEGKAVWHPVTDVTFNLSAAGQYSPGSLFASEEIAFGGTAYGRAFAPSEISGDSGVGVSFQPEYRIALDGDTSITPYLVGDYSRVFNRRIELQPGGELTSAGGGIKLGLGGGLIVITLEADKPLNRTPLDRSNRDWRFYTGLEIGMDKALSLIAGIL